jgi:class 3 adenylate cyclase/tetratricopeptide (TPR) repeat protein
MSEKISAWLDGLGLGQYAPAFEENAVDPGILPELTDTDLKDLGVAALGHRKIILKAVRSLQAFPETDTIDPDLVSEHDSSAWSRTPGERRPVTMLFADIANSTALTEKLDAEEAHKLLYRATQHMCEAVEKNQGTVCRFMGDGIMAMFGAPRASERHALEACRAAIDMQKSVAQYSGELQANHRPSIQIRVGLNSGEVVVLEVGDDPNKPEYDASGPTVPLAARMEQATEPGTILITEHTFSQAGDLLEVEKQPAITVKGLSEPVEVFRLTAMRSAIDLDSTNSRRRFVGRKSELAQFRGIVDTCLESGLGQIVHIRGEAGIGKTRIAAEMSNIARDKEFDCHKVLVLDFGAGKGQRVVPALARSLLGIKSNSGKQARQQALDMAEADGLVQADQRVFVNDLLDLDQPLELRTLYDAMDAETRSQGKQEVLKGILEQRSRIRPNLLIIEDLHWTDNISMAFLARLAASVAECPALMVTTSRVEGDPVDAAWRIGIGETPVVIWDIGPLRQQDAEQLVTEFIDTSDALTRSCVERAAGNPLFLEQLLMSIEKGTADVVPDSIKSLVLTRMDRLSQTDNQALRAASVLGQRFQLETLRYLIDETAYDCNNLLVHNLLRSEGTYCLFAHALIQEAAYSALLTKQRSKWHLRAAAWYVERDLVLYAEHLQYAGDSGAPMAYHAAAREQLDKFRPELALQLVRAGLEIAHEADSFELKFLEGELLKVTGSVSESSAAFENATAMAASDIERCRAIVGVCDCLELVDAHEEMVAKFDEAIRIARENNMSWELARIYQLQGGVYFFKGQFTECLRLNELSLQCARDAAAPDLEARALSGLGDAEYSRGRYLTAKLHFDRCIALAREHGLGQTVAANLPMRAIMSIWQNDVEVAIQNYRNAMDLAVKTGHLRAEMITSTAGIFIAEMVDMNEGEKWLRRGMEISRQLGTRLFEAECLTHLGKLMNLRGNNAEANRLAIKAVEILHNAESGLTYFGACAYGVMARTTEQRDDYRSALMAAEAILADGAVAHNYLIFFEDAMEACLQWADWDDVERYADAMEDYTHEEPLPRSDYYIARGRALVRHGRGEDTPELKAELTRLSDEAIRIHLPNAGSALENALAR